MFLGNTNLQGKYQVKLEGIVEFVRFRNDWVVLVGDQKKYRRYPLCRHPHAFDGVALERLE